MGNSILGHLNPRLGLKLWPCLQSREMDGGAAAAVITVGDALVSYLKELWAIVD